jgi:hypothetical protein
LKSNLLNSAAAWQNSGLLSNFYNAFYHSIHSYKLSLKRIVYIFYQYKYNESINKGSLELAIETWNQIKENSIPLNIDLLKRAGNCFEKFRQWHIAGENFEKARFWKKAGACFEKAQLWERAGVCFEVAELWKKAGICFEKLNLYERAGVNFEKKGLWFRAAENYENAKLWERAGVCYTELKMWERAGVDFELAELWERAGFCYEEAELWQKSAICLEKVGLWERAGVNYEKDELSLKTKWKQDFHEISEKCQTAIPDLFTRLQTHLDIYKSFTSAIHKLSIAEFSKFYNQYKSLPLIIQTNDKLISTFIHACAKYNMIQLTKRVPNNQSIVECRDCAWDIHQKLKDTKKDFLKNKYFSQASVDEAFNRPIKQSEYLFNFLQYLYKGDDEQNGNKVKKIIKQLEPEIRSAWHLNNLISQKRVCYLTVNSPLSITYNFEGYQIEAIPDLGDKPTPCKIYDKSKCKIELPDNVGCQLRFLSDPREITRIKGVRNKTNNEEKITVPKTLFKEICITENINNAAVFKLYPIKHFDGTPNYITHCNFNSPRKCLDILPGDYVYTLISVPQKNLDCSSSGMLNKWFESITVHDNNEIVIELFKNQMKTKNKADSYLNKCMKRIKSKKFGERQKKEYLDHTKGNVCFFKYFLPWYCKQYSEPLIWQNLVEPVTRCSDYKWFRHYRIPQLQQLGVDTSSNNNKLLCHLFYTQLDLISNKKPQHLEIAQNRQMYLNLLKKVVVVHEIYKKLERYADYVYEDE